MIINNFERVRPMTLISFFPKNKRLKLSEQSLKQMTNKPLKVK